MVKLASIYQNTINFFSRKPDNALIVSRAKQYSGEWSKELPYPRFYDYYHQTPSVKRNINSIHRRWMGSSIEIKSQDATWDKMWKIWSDTVDFIPKLKEFTLDTLITGTGLFEKQFYGTMFANLEHVPTKTLWKMFRDEFATYLSIWQLSDGGDTKQLAPKNMIVFTINNPERDAVGKSAMYAVAVPQKIAGKVDSLGNPINPDRYLPSILDVKTRLNFAHMEIAEKQARARWFVSIKNMKDKKRQQEIEKDLEDEESSKYITVTDGEVTTNAIEFKNAVANEKYLNDMDQDINRGTGYPGNVIDKGGEMGYASSQTPMQDLSMSIEDMQNDLSDVIQDEIFKPLCEQWGLDYEKVQPKLVFNTFVEKITFEQLIKIPSDHPIADLEIRGAYKEFLPGMDDKLWEAFKKERDARVQQEMQMKMGGKTDPSRPDIEKEAPKPDKTMEYLLKNPKEFEAYITELVTKKSVEGQTVSHWISELSKAHPEWKHDQVVAVAIKKSKEYAGYFAMPPIDGQPYESKPPEITNAEVLKRLEEMVKETKDDNILKKIESTIKEKMTNESARMHSEITEFKKQVESARLQLEERVQHKIMEGALSKEERKELGQMRRELTVLHKSAEFGNMTTEMLEAKKKAYEAYQKKIEEWDPNA